MIDKSDDKIIIEILEEEYWWCGLSSMGYEYPYDKNSDENYNLWGDNYGNQSQPLLISSKGRYIWSEDPFEYTFKDGKIIVSTLKGKILSGQKGDNLLDVYNYVSKSFFPSNGEIPDSDLFTFPQYNTWIELMYDQNEQDILKYANDIIDNGYDPGVLMIDDNWQIDYGVWDFSHERFDDPKNMIKQLHDLGFEVMLWVCPFVSADSEEYRFLRNQGMLIMEDNSTQPAIIRWWNGASACLDLSNPKTSEWFKEKLDFLQKEYGVDGFKFDAGDADFYTNNVRSYKAQTPNDHTTYFAKMALDYPLNEFRASWKMAGLPLAQRLRDKGHNWEDLQKLIPDQMSQSVMGYSYTCPDMIGGGEFKSFLNAATIDQELVVRSAQVHALMPMMQFSVAPWRVLSDENNQICLNMAKLHTKMGDYILDLAKQSSITGMPIVQPMALAFPEGGFENVKDQYMLGKNILVAPVVHKGVRSRSVILPEGKWKSDEGKIVKGGKTIKIDVPLSRLPFFTRIEN